MHRETQCERNVQNDPKSTFFSFNTRYVKLYLWKCIKIQKKKHFPQLFYKTSDIEMYILRRWTSTTFNVQLYMPHIFMHDSHMKIRYYSMASAKITSFALALSVSCVFTQHFNKEKQLVSVILIENCMYQTNGSHLFVKWTLITADNSAPIRSIEECNMINSDQMNECALARKHWTLRIR